MDNIAQAYAEAFKTVNGYAPTIEPNGNRYRVTTNHGACADYTARDLTNLTRGLLHIARRA